MPFALLPFYQQRQSVVQWFGIQPCTNAALIWIVTKPSCHIEKMLHFVWAEVKLRCFLYISVCSNDRWVLSRLQMQHDCCSSALWCLLGPFGGSALCFCLSLFFSLCSVFGSLYCLTLHSHQSCCCLWIAILLWSKADLAAAQQACLWVLAAMLADPNVPAWAFFLSFFFFVVYLCEC